MFEQHSWVKYKGKPAYIIFVHTGYLYEIMVLTDTSSYKVFVTENEITDIQIPKISLNNCYLYKSFRINYLPPDTVATVTAIENGPYPYVIETKYGTCNVSPFDLQPINYER